MKINPINQIFGNLDHLIEFIDSHTGNIGGKEVEDIIKELRERAKQRNPRSKLEKIVDYSIAIGSAALAFKLVGPIALYSVVLGYASERWINYRQGRDQPSRQVRNTALLNSMITVVGYSLFEVMIENFNTKTLKGFLYRAITQYGSVNPLLFVVFTIPSFRLTYGTFKGAYQYGLKSLAKRNYITSTVYFGILNLLAARFAPPWFQYSFGLSLSFFYRVITSQRYIKEIDPYVNEYKVIDGRPLFNPSVKK